MPFLTVFSSLFSTAYFYVLLVLCGIVVGYVALFAGGLRIVYAKPVIFPALVAAIFLISTLFSISRRFSFDGFDLEAGTVASVLALLALFWLSIVWLRNGLRVRAILFAMMATTTLVVVADLFIAILRSVVAHEAAGISSMSDVTFMAGFALVLSLALPKYFSLNPIGRFACTVSTLLCATFLLFAPVTFVWCSVGIVAILMCIERFRAHHRSSAGLFCAVGIASLLLFFCGNSIPFPRMSAGMPVSPQFSDAVAVVAASYRASPIRAFVGTGPNTYAQAWELYKPVSVNKTPLWNMTYTQGVGLYDSVAVTVGILGIVAALAMLVLAIRSGWRRVVTLDETEDRCLLCVSFFAAMYGWLAFIGYMPNMISLVAIVAVSGIATAWTIDTDKFRRLILVSKTKPWLAGVMVLSVCVILLVCLIIRTYSVVLYNGGVEQVMQNQNVDASQALISKAVSIFPQPVYYRALSEVQQERMAQLVVDTSMPKEESAAGFGIYAQAAVKNARKAVDMEPANVLNWIVLGNVYAQLALAKVAGAPQQGSDAYAHAIALEPSNPFPFFLQAKLAEAVGDVGNVRAFAYRALVLKPDYVDARILYSKQQ